MEEEGTKGVRKGSFKSQCWFTFMTHSFTDMLTTLQHPPTNMPTAPPPGATPSHLGRTTFTITRGRNHLWAGRTSTWGRRHYR